MPSGTGISTRFPPTPARGLANLSGHVSTWCPWRRPRAHSGVRVGRSQGLGKGHPPEAAPEIVLYLHS